LKEKRMPKSAEDQQLYDVATMLGETKELLAKFLLNKNPNHSKVSGLIHIYNQIQIAEAMLRQMEVVWSDGEGD
jgi:hypothetical protein